LRDKKSLEEDTEEPVKPEPVQQQPRFRSKIRMSNTKFHRGTVRSGQLVSFDGNLVIIGDVNPGGEVCVMGSLRGMVHAGANGNREALVVALNLQPTQLRIADVITRPPDEKETVGQFFPELAYVKDGMVYIERYLPAR